PALARNRPGLRVRNTWDFREFRLPWSRSAVDSRASRARIDLDRRVCRSRSSADLALQVLQVRLSKGWSTRGVAPVRERLPPFLASGAILSATQAFEDWCELLPFWRRRADWSPLP